jgi:hypothetical protein
MISSHDPYSSLCNIVYSIHYLYFCFLLLLALSTFPFLFESVPCFFTFCTTPSINAFSVLSGTFLKLTKIKETYNLAPTLRTICDVLLFWNISSSPVVVLLCFFAFISSCIFFNRFSTFCLPDPFPWNLYESCLYAYKWKEKVYMNEFEKSTSFGVNSRPY